jgi:hypothetical protein
MMTPLMTARPIAAIAFPPMLYCQCPGQGKTPLPPAATAQLELAPPARMPIAGRGRGLD